MRDLELEARIGTEEGTKMTEKGGMVVRETDVRRDPISLVPVHVGIVPIHKNHVNAGTVPIPKNHVNAGTVPILESSVDVGTVHFHTDMLTGVRVPQRSDDPTT